MDQGTYFCRGCGTKLTETNGIVKCYQCSGNQMGIPANEIDYRVMRAKQWISYGAYAEARKELSLVEQHQIDGTGIQMLYLMMDLKVAREDELKLLKNDFSQNPHYIRIMEFHNNFPQEAVATKLTDYARSAMTNQTLEENRLANEAFKSNCIWLGVVTAVLYYCYCFLSKEYVGMGDTIARKAWIAWAVTAVWLFFRKGLSEKMRILLTGGLILAWIYFFMEKAFWL